MSKLNMLESVQQYPPISGAGWDLVAVCHSCFCPDLEQSGDQLSKKIDKPARRIQTYIYGQDAKAVSLLIVEKSEDIIGSEDEGFADDDDDEEVEDVAVEE